MSTIKTQHIALGVALAVTVVVAYTLLMKKKEKPSKRRSTPAKCEASPTPLPNGNEENRLDSGIASPKDTPTAKNRSLDEQDDFAGKFIDVDESFSAVCHVSNRFETSSMFVETSVLSTDGRLPSGDLNESDILTCVQPESESSKVEPEIEEKVLEALDALREDSGAPELQCPEVVATVEEEAEEQVQDVSSTVECQEPETVEETVKPLPSQKAPSPEKRIVSVPDASGDGGERKTPEKTQRRTPKRDSLPREEVQTEGQFKASKPSTPSTRQKLKSKEKEVKEVEKRTELPVDTKLDDHKNNNVESLNSENVQRTTSTINEMSRRNSIEYPDTVNDSTKSDASGDSGKGESEIGLPPIPFKHEFELPQTLCGRLIGKKGATVQYIKNTTGATVTVRENPLNPVMRTVYVVGKEEQVKKALELIKRKFPRKDYPELRFESGKPQPFIRFFTLSFEADNMVTVTALESAAHLFVRLTSLNIAALFNEFEIRLNEAYLGENIGDLPVLAKTAAVPGALCVAIIDNTCYRCEIDSLVDNDERVVVKYLDHGGYDTIPMTACKQIRADLVHHPFQAIEVELAGIEPVGDDWSHQAFNVTQQFVDGKTNLFARVVRLVENRPNILLFRVLENGHHLNLAEDLVAAGEAVWTEMNIAKQNGTAPSFTPSDFPVLRSPETDIQ